MIQLNFRPRFTKVLFLLVFLLAYGFICAQNDTTSIITKKDTTTIIVGSKEIIITDSDDEDSLKHIERNIWRSGGFKGHWSGVELGLNNYLNSDRKMNLPAGADFMSLNTNRSINVNVNFAQHSFGIIGNSLGIVTGLSFEYSNYFFEKDNSIHVDSVGNIGPKTFGIGLDKSKLTTWYLTVPLLFEFQFPGSFSRSKRLYVSAGVIGGIKLSSHTKVVYYQNGKKQKEKNHDDLNVSPFKYGFTARVGYKHLSIFANYYASSLFEKGKTPELYPYSIGIAFLTSK